MYLNLRLRMIVTHVLCTQSQYDYPTTRYLEEKGTWETKHKQIQSTVFDGIIWYQEQLSDFKRYQHLVDSKCEIVLYRGDSEIESFELFNNKQLADLKLLQTSIRSSVQYALDNPMVGTPTLEEKYIEYIS